MAQHDGCLLIDQYMKNYPFAEARVRRESETNEGFRVFLEERNSDELTQKRNVVGAKAVGLTGGRS